MTARQVPLLLLFTLTAWLIVVPSVRSQIVTAVTRTVEVAGHAMHVRTAGLDQRRIGSPVIVLEAGAMNGLETWNSVFDQIAAVAPVIAYDRRGLGKSEADGRPQTFKYVAASLRALLTEMKVEAPYVLVGQSYGGILIRSFAQEFPTEVAGLVYLDAPDLEITRAEAAALPPGAEEAIFTVPSPPAGTAPGPLAEMENIREHIRTEFVEARKIRPPAHIPTAVVIAGAKTWAGMSREAVGGLLRLQVKHQQEWTLGSPYGLLIVPTRLTHMVHISDPALTVRVIQHVLSAASASK